MWFPGSILFVGHCVNQNAGLAAPFLVSTGRAFCASSRTRRSEWWARLEAALAASCISQTLVFLQFLPAMCMGTQEASGERDVLRPTAWNSSRDKWPQLEKCATSGNWSRLSAAEALCLNALALPPLLTGARQWGEKLATLCPALG